MPAIYIPQSIPHISSFSKTKLSSADDSASLIIQETKEKGDMPLKVSFINNSLI